MKSAHLKKLAESCKGNEEKKEGEKKGKMMTHV